MNAGWSPLKQFLRTDPCDAGCAGTFDALDSYAELTLATADAEDRYPGVAAHLRICDPCAEDLRGLLRAAQRST